MYSNAGAVLPQWTPDRTGRRDRDRVRGDRGGESLLTDADVLANALANTVKTTPPTHGTTATAV
jgi:hypothetical protein